MQVFLKKAVKTSKKKINPPFGFSYCLNNHMNTLFLNLGFKKCPHTEFLFAKFQFGENFYSFYKNP
jgi:hypothetical protein